MRASPILLALVGIALLSATDAAVKVVALTDGVLTATWLRYVFGGALTLPPLFLLKRPLPGANGLKIHALRGFLLAGTSLSFFYAISILSLAETITLAFVAPLIVPPLAALILKEPLRGNVFLAAIAGFMGVLVTVQGAGVGDGGADRPFAITAVLLSAVLYASQALILRARAQVDDGFAIVALATVVPLIVLTPLTLLLAPLPSISSLIPSFLAGLFAACGFLVLTAAYARSEAQVLIVVEYSGLLWAAVLGWFLFREEPRLEIFLGAAIIASACVYIAWAERPGRMTSKGSAF